MTVRSVVDRVLQLITTHHLGGVGGGLSNCHLRSIRLQRKSLMRLPVEGMNPC